MRRLRFYRLLATLASTSVVAATLTIAVGAGNAGAAAAAGAACTFNGTPTNGVVSGITPGASVTVECTGLPDSTPLVMVEVSPLTGLLPSADDEDEADTGALGLVTSTSTGTLPPGTAFKVPDPFKASDPDGVCPLSAAQVNAGLVGCTLALASFAGTSYGNVTLQYSGQTPEAPSLALGSSSAHAGDQVTVEDGSGSGNWWGDADSSVSLSPSDITIHGVHSGSTTAAVSAATYSVTVKAKKIVPGPFTPPKLGGAFTVPCGVAGHQTVTVTEPNSSGLSGTISASASLDVLPGSTPAVTAISPDRGPSGGGTPVTISGCNFTGAESVSFGRQSAASFHVNSDTSITAVSPPGTGTVYIVVTGSGGSSQESSATAFTYGLQGYDLAGGDGGTFSFGDAHNYGSLPGLGVTPAKPIVGIAATADGNGYWLAGADGGTFAFGDAHSYGSLPGLGIKPAAPIVGIASPDSGGYWLVGADGGTFAFGDAHNYGSLPGLGIKPAAPIVAIVPTQDGKGYWLVGADGGTFAFGDAHSYGSLPGLGIKPATPIVGIAPTSDGKGYWLVGADGGTFAFGDAHNYGSLPGLGIKPAKPIVAIISPDSGGYWLVGADGGAFSFGDARFFGSLGSQHLAAAISGGSLA